MIKVGLIGYGKYGKKYYTNIINDKKFKIIKILKKSSNYIKFSSHPCGSYNKNSLKVLKELGIDIAFKDSMTIDYEMGMNSINNSSLEIFILCTDIYTELTIHTTVINIGARTTW